MRLDVHEMQPQRACDRVHGADLVQQVLAQIVRPELDRFSSKTRAVGIRGVRTHGDVVSGGGAQGGRDDARIACMKPTGDIGGGDVMEDRFIVATTPGAERLSHICVEVDAQLFCHASASRKAAVLAISASAASASVACAKRTLSPGQSCAVSGMSAAITTSGTA